MKQNKLKQAVTAFEKALQLQPNAFAALKAGAISERLKNYPAAESFYRQAIKALPNNFAAYNQLAWFFAEQNKNIDEGIELANKALSLSPESPNILDTLGWLYFKKGSLSKAHATLKKAKKSSTSHSITFHLAMIEKKMGKTKQATALLDEITKSTVQSKYSEKAKLELQRL